VRNKYAKFARILFQVQGATREGIEIPDRGATQKLEKKAATLHPDEQREQDF
jgi:hypothetical protein